MKIIHPIPAQRKEPQNVSGQAKTTPFRSLPVDNKTIDLAIASDFNDFEDAVQHSCAIENNLTTIITRNVKDYKKASIAVLTPETFIALPD